MYPSDELAALGARKQRLLTRIRLRRTETQLLGEIISARVAVFESWRERISRWSGVAATFFPFLRVARAEMTRPRPKGRVGRAFHWLRLGLKLARSLRPLTYVFRAG